MQLADDCLNLIARVQMATIARRIQLVLHPDDRAGVEAYEKQLRLYPGSAAQVFGATDGIMYSIVAAPGEPAVFLPEQSRYLRADELAH